MAQQIAARLGRADMWREAGEELLRGVTGDRPATIAALPSHQVVAAQPSMDAGERPAHDSTSSLVAYVQHRPECQASATCTCGHRYREHLGLGERCVHNPISCLCSAFQGVACTCGLDALLSQSSSKGLEPGARICDNGHTCDVGYPCPECAKSPFSDQE